jgi:D-3-phosphoglycerate dehydrogenase
MFKVLTLNNIAVEGLRHFPRDRYEVASEIAHPDAAIGRAGAGTNNIPIESMSARGIPVFNAPGANANAVKELAIAGLLIAARNICDAREYVRGLADTGDKLEKAVEAAKKQFVGFELPGKTLGVIGLGAIGVEVANAALALGMKVVGFDPKITVRRAWQLSAGVEHADTLDQLFQKSDAVTCHIPLVEETKNLVNRDRISLMRNGGVIINFARSGVVDDAAVIAALDSGKLHTYVSDFPTAALIAHKKLCDHGCRESQRLSRERQRSVFR